MIKNRKYLCTCALVGAIVGSSVLGGIPVQAATINNKPAQLVTAKYTLHGTAATMICDGYIYSSPSLKRGAVRLSEGDPITVLEDYGSYSSVIADGKYGYVYNYQFAFD